MKRILSSYLDSLIMLRRSDRARFRRDHGANDPGGMLLAGRFRECVPVVGDETCVWSLSSRAVQRKEWNPSAEGVPMTSPWKSWFLDVLPPKKIVWAGRERDWFGPPCWGWIVTQNDVGEFFSDVARWAGVATLVMPHRNLSLPTATDWTLGWMLDKQGIPVWAEEQNPENVEHYKLLGVPDWRSTEAAQEWSYLLSAPLWRTLQLLNARNVEREWKKSKGKPGKRRRGRKRKRGKPYKEKPEITYCVLKVEGAQGPSGPGLGGTHASPKYHLRRGGWKNYGIHDRKGPEGSCSRCGSSPPHEGICGKGYFGRGKVASIWVPAHTVGSRRRGENVNMYAVGEAGES